MASTLGDLIAQGALPADIGKREQDIAQATTYSTSDAASAQPAIAPADMRAQEQAEIGAGQVPSTSADQAPNISQSASSEAIERVRRQVSDETQAMRSRFATPWNGR